MQDWMILPILVLLFGGMVALTQGVFYILRQQAGKKDKWLRRRLGFEDADDGEDSGEGAIIKEMSADQASEWLGNLGESLEMTIRAAGSEMTVTALLVQVVGLLVGFSVVGIAMMGPPGLMMGIIGCTFPYLYIKRQAAQRSQMLLGQMPDALELMGRAMQAGTGLSDSFRLVAEEMPLPIAGEWGRVFEETRFGKEWRDALSTLVGRNPMIFDLRLFASSILLQRETGGNLIESLNSISRMIRNRYVFDAKVQAMTSEARTSGMVLASMPLGVICLIMFANPDYLTPLVDDSLGNILLMYCATSYLLGLYIMKTTTSVEV